MRDTKIEVTKGVPMPGVTRKFGLRRYPFNQMEVGDSFAVPKDADSKAVRTAAYCYGGRHGMKFACRKVDDGYRIWRVS